MSNDNRVILNNPKILTWAREEAELTLDNVGVRFKKSAAMIEAWENGTESPTFRQLVELSNYYKRPVPVFFLPSIPPKSPKPHDYRTLSGVNLGHYSRETLFAYREVLNMLSYTKSLLDELDMNMTYSLPTWTMDDDPEFKAEEIRSLLGISIEQQIKMFDMYKTAEDSWRDVLFRRGVIVRICAMPIADARAFCLFGSGLAGIGLSSQDREHGRIFSLFHEVCHLSLNRPGVSGIMTKGRSRSQSLEQYCDRFAASFLLPRSNPEVYDSLKLFQGSSIDYLQLSQYVARKFKVSKYVAIRRALDLKFITPLIYWQIMPEWRKLDARYAASHKPKGGNRNVTQMNYVGKHFAILVMRWTPLLEQDRGEIKIGSRYPAGV